MPKNRTLKVVAGIAASFTGLVGTIIFLLEKKIISVEMAILMLVALLAMYVGFGILIAVYRLIGKLEWAPYRHGETELKPCAGNLVILRGDEMAELPTDAVNSRNRPERDDPDRQLCGRLKMVIGTA
jgi:hypothetical protein